MTPTEPTTPDQPDNGDDEQQGTDPVAERRKELGLESETQEVGEVQHEQPDPTRHEGGEADAERRSD